MVPLNSSDQALLKDILGDDLIADSAANKLPEGGLVLKQPLNDPTRSSLIHHDSPPIIFLHPLPGYSE
jgi:hypothetical protein